jgi:hypothetical protein
MQLTKVGRYLYKNPSNNNNKKAFLYMNPRSQLNTITHEVLNLVTVPDYAINTNDLETPLMEIKPEANKIRIDFLNT